MCIEEATLLPSAGNQWVLHEQQAFFAESNFKTQWILSSHKLCTKKTPCAIRRRFCFVQLSCFISETHLQVEDSFTSVMSKVWLTGQCDPRSSSHQPIGSYYKINYMWTPELCSQIVKSRWKPLATCGYLTFRAVKAKWEDQIYLFLWSKVQDKKPCFPVHDLNLEDYSERFIVDCGKKEKTLVGFFQTIFILIPAFHRNFDLKII